MKTRSELIENDAYLLTKPGMQSLPFVFASPHSGDDYSQEFLAQSRLDATAIRRSEDCFVHELFHDAPVLGSPLMRARFPRAYLDPNREPYELDPKMFAGPLPSFVNSRSARVSVGLGTIARVVSNGAEIYRKKLDFAEVEQRIDRLYFPYHAMIKQLLVATRAKEIGVTEDQMIEEVTKEIPLRRANDPEDIAAMVVFLASLGARNITGQCYNVDGGLVTS